MYLIYKKVKDGTQHEQNSRKNQNNNKKYKKKPFASIYLF
jgi:hypothetical protein